MGRSEDWTHGRHWLQVQSEVIEYRHDASPEYHKTKMPGMQKYADITMKRGTVGTVQITPRLPGKQASSSHGPGFFRSYCSKGMSDLIPRIVTRLPDS